MSTSRIYDAITSHVLEHRSIYFFTATLFLIGVIVGAVIVNSLSLSQRHDLFTYVSQFFHEMNKGYIDVSSSDLFVHSFMHYGKYFGFLWVLGVSLIGLPVIFVLLFAKGVVVGFTVGFLVNQMGAQGFLLSFVSVLPQNIILVPAFIVVSTVSAAFCIRLMRQTIGKVESEPFFPHFLRYTMLVLTVGAFVTVASFFEAYVSPVLMRAVVTSF
ncbi:stage II sporulation protein M [Shouchella lonarensis]|uniref:Stage II sporulation protein M n=1 Tax=Shouchella lonarensis TaxID=1464122 RepID=A0A1G6LH60_9BACI|nr:stage II sporulation protein M [Shouchella lonarensis]SDC42544.1 stage II sporulation protein M [Shouchella lonarensis]